MSLAHMQDITVDIYKDTYFRHIYAKQHDNNARVLRITLTEDGTPIIPGEGVTAIFRAKKPPQPSNSGRGETYILNSATIDEDGRVLVILTAQTLAVAGVVNCEVSLVKGNDILSTATFRIFVEESNVKPDITSEDEFLFLLEAVERANQAVKDVNAAIDDAGHSPYINEETNTWYIWDTETHSYKDSGVRASRLIDENSGKEVRMWFGTIEEYNAIPDHDPDVYYNILEGTP